MKVKDTAVVSAAAILPVSSEITSIDINPVDEATVSLKVSLAPDSGSLAASNAVRPVLWPGFCSDNVFSTALVVH